MKKLLKDWTLLELKQHCNAPHCDGCPAFTYREYLGYEDCTFKNYYPKNWDLADYQQCTKEEVETAKKLMLVFIGEDVSICRENNITFLQIDPVGVKICIDENAFPSIREGERVRLVDIVGEEG
jgi:hypothetical protein